MFKPIPGNSELEISLEGEIRSRILTMQGPGCTPVVQDGQVTLKRWGKLETADITWLSHMAHYEAWLPEDLRRHEKVIYFSGDQMLFKRPIQAIEGYRVVPGFVRYGVFRGGDVVDLYTGRELTQTVPSSNKEYIKVTVYDSRRGYSRHMVLHRLVALAWVPNDDVENKIWVNHKDGNKRNPRWDNLEWVTPKGNNLHAIETGLRTDNVPTRVRDVRTGEVKELPSTRQACEFMGISPDYYRSNTVPVRQNALVAKYYEVRIGDDSRPWVHTDKIKKAGRYITTVTHPDGKKETFHDNRDVIKHFKLWNMASMSAVCIVERMAEDYPELKVEIVDQYDARPIEAREIATGAVQETSTIRAMSALVGMDHRRIRQLLVKPTIVQENGFAFRYKSNEPWPKEIPSPTSRSLCIVATHDTTEETLTFKSLREASAHFNVDRSLIKVRLKNKKHHQGWRFNEVESLSS